MAEPRAQLTGTGDPGAGIESVVFAPIPIQVEPYTPTVVTTPLIDTAFDMRTDAGGRDPDRYSTTLRRYHQQLWSKPLPSRAAFDLDPRLHHKSALGEFWLSSDGIVQTYTRWSRPPRLVEVLAEIPFEDLTAFSDLAGTIGAFVVFPVRTSVGGRLQQSVNQGRGMHPLIRDRFDLTLECIRRQYAGLESPLGKVLTLHAHFFNLFDNFRGYVEHFLLQDLVGDDVDSVRFFQDFDNFLGEPLPAARPDDYREYMRRSMAFSRARNERIAAYAALRAGHPERDHH